MTGMDVHNIPTEVSILEYVISMDAGVGVGETALHCPHRDIDHIPCRISIFHNVA
jgi:hypothetical protein